MSHSNASAAELLVQHIDLITDLEPQSGVLDLACGYGRNGLFLASHNVKVIFADNNMAALDVVSATLNERRWPGECWPVDLEDGSGPLNTHCFDAVIVFNYLHRPLFDALRAAIRPGGLIVYETFTVAQASLGRPSNPDYLLQPGELVQHFPGWEVLHEFEGEEGKSGKPTRAIASLIARKPRTG